jgi:hypothetical protein
MMIMVMLGDVPPLVWIKLVKDQVKSATAEKSKPQASTERSDSCEVVRCGFNLYMIIAVAVRTSSHDD